MKNPTSFQQTQANDQIQKLSVSDRTSTLSPKNPMNPLSDSYQKSVQVLPEITKGRSDSTAHAVILAIVFMFTLLVISGTSIVIFLNIS
ncbi:MAG: hypothetical protein AAGA60_04380 [Cyanobacteria bacterium P01_E01_bin.42]